jgi:hypothetical protein
MNCEKCRIGHFRSVSAPYLHWLGGQIMAVPHAPALACDICDYLSYEPEFESKLQFFLDQLAGDEQISNTARQQLMVGEPTDWQPSRRSR